VKSISEKDSSLSFFTILQKIVVPRGADGQSKPGIKYWYVKYFSYFVYGLFKV
jgi:hypothetical protein